MATRDELVAAVVDRYACSDRPERGRILDEFVAVTGILTQLRLVQLEADEHGCFSASVDAAPRNLASLLEALASGRAAA